MRNPNATTILEYLEAFGTLKGKEADEIMTFRVQFGESELEMATDANLLKEHIQTAIDSSSVSEFNRGLHEWLLEAASDFLVGTSDASFIILPPSVVNDFKERHGFVPFEGTSPVIGIHLIGHSKGVPVYVDPMFKWTDRQVYIVIGDPTEPVIKRIKEDLSRTIYFRKPTELTIFRWTYPERF